MKVTLVSKTHHINSLRVILCKAACFKITTYRSGWLANLTSIYVPSAFKKSALITKKTFACFCEVV